MRLPVLIAALLVLGAALVACLFLLPDEGLLDTGLSIQAAFLGLIVLAAFSELAYVRVPHGESTEDLTFFEAVVVMATLVLAPVLVLVGALVGLTVAWIVMRRPLVKTLFNLGMFMVATSAMLLVARAIVGPEQITTIDLRLVIAVLAGTAAFGVVNLLALAAVMVVLEGMHPLDWMRAEAVGSLMMVGGNVGVAVIFVSMAMSSPILLPFVGLPVLALVHSFKQSQRHARERDRANALVELSSALTASGDPDALIDGLLAPLRKVFDADRATITLFVDEEVTVNAEDRVVVARSRRRRAGQPEPWLGRDSWGRRRPFPKSAGKRPVDEPLLATTASAISSVLRSARHVTALIEESSSCRQSSTTRRTASP